MRAEKRRPAHPPTDRPTDLSSRFLLPWDHRLRSPPPTPNQPSVRGTTGTVPAELLGRFWVGLLVAVYTHNTGPYPYTPQERGGTLFSLIPEMRRRKREEGGSFPWVLAASSGRGGGKKLSWAVRRWCKVWWQGGKKFLRRRIFFPLVPHATLSALVPPLPQVLFSNLIPSLD